MIVGQFFKNQNKYFQKCSLRSSSAVKPTRLNFVSKGGELTMAKKRRTVKRKAAKKPAKRKAAKRKTTKKRPARRKKR